MWPSSSNFICHKQLFVYKQANAPNLSECLIHNSILVNIISLKMFQRLLFPLHRNRRLPIQKLKYTIATIKSCNAPDIVNSSANRTHELSLHPSHIQEAIKLVPALASIEPQMWERAHGTFINHGLDTIGFLQIVTSNSALLSRPSHKIIQCLEYWRSCQFGEKLLHLLLIKYPELFDISDGHKLLTHIGFLKSYVGTSKNVWKLLMNSPDLLEQTEQNITRKFEYIQKQMRIDIPEIVKSAALSKNFEDLRCRHIFLVRLGLFKPRSLRAHPDEPTKNNRLYQITDTSEKAFANKICHVTLDEFEAFQDLYEKELIKKRKQVEEENDFSDDD